MASGGADTACGQKGAGDPGKEAMVDAVGQRPHGHRVRKSPLPDITTHTALWEPK